MRNTFWIIKIYVSSVFSTYFSNCTFKLKALTWRKIMEDAHPSFLFRYCLGKSKGWTIYSYHQYLKQILTLLIKSLNCYTEFFETKGFHIFVLITSPSIIVVWHEKNIFIGFKSHYKLFTSWAVCSIYKARDSLKFLQNANIRIES